MILNFFRRYSQIIIPLLLFLYFIHLRIHRPGGVEKLQLKVFDVFQQLNPRIYHNTPVIIVDIDDKSLSQMGQWPWSRDKIAELIARLNRAGASVIVLDILLAEPDRTSPRNIVSALSRNPEFKNLDIDLEKLPDYDATLAETIQKTKMVTSFSLIRKHNSNQPALKTGFAYLGNDPVSYTPSFQGAVPTLSTLETSASGNGSLNILVERDGILRRIPLLFTLRGNLYPSLVLETIRLAQGASTDVIKSTGSTHTSIFEGNSGIFSIKTGRLTIPTDSMGRMWLYDTGHNEKRFIPAWKVFEKDFDPNQIKRKIVFIGTSAEGLKDFRTTPFNAVTPGVEIHAQLTEQILFGEFLHRPDWADDIELLFIVILGLILIFLLPFVGPLLCAFTAFVAIASAFAICWDAFLSWNFLFDPVLPSLAVLLIYFSSSFFHYLRTESERGHIRSAFAHYMSPVLIEQLTKHPEKLKLGGETKNMTFLFSDIRNFTTIAEQSDAQELTHFMNRFLTPMTDIILKNNGTIDKYVGDCIIAFWNAPLDDPDHARHACETALQMKGHLVDWNRQIIEEAKAKGKTLPPIKIGIGINTGDGCVGNMGSEQRFDYSVLGDDVNLASRIENLSKIYGLDILIGENTYQKTNSLAALEIDLIKVKGKTKPVRIYALLGSSDLGKNAEFQRVIKKNQELLAAYRNQNWQVARKLSEECAGTRIPNIDLTVFYKLLDSRMDDYLVNPPPRDWGGVTIVDTK